ncbi:MAG: phage tail tape measure protein [Bacteroidales bacterium]|nr:phage tail tape measure protein [Bacteroidales bacterium]
MADTQVRANITLTGTDKASAPLKAAQKAVEAVEGAVKDATLSVKTFSSRMEDLRPAFTKMRNVGALAFAAVAGEVTLAAKAFAESQKQLALVDAVIVTLSEDTLKGFGGSLDEAKRKAREFGAEMQAKGGIGDEDAATGLVKLTQITKDYAKATEAARIAADFAKFSQTDYLSAVDIVGKVISGNVGILGRYGIQLEKGATAEEALAEMAKRSAGQYEAYGKTLAGQSEILKQTMGDLQEEIGEALVPALTKLLEKLTPVISAVIKFADENPKALASIIAVTGGLALMLTALGTVGLALPSVIVGVKSLGVALAFVAANPMVVLAAAIAALGFLLYKVFVKDWAKTKDSFLYLWDGLKTAVGQAVDWLTAKIQPLFDLFGKVKGGISSATSSWRNLPANLGIPGFADGGTVPGPLGQPRLAVVHGGEEVIPVGGTGRGFTFNFYGDVNDRDALKRDIIEALDRRATLAAI